MTVTINLLPLCILQDTKNYPTVVFIITQTLAFVKRGQKKIFGILQYIKYIKGGFFMSIFKLDSQTIKKAIVDTLKITMEATEEKMTKQDIAKKIENLKGLMSSAASRLDFETAINLREEIAKLKRKLK